MKSAVYLGTITHARQAVTNYRFSQTMPWWLLDLSEVDELSRRFWGFRRGNFSLFAFRDHDHIHLGHATARENILAWVREQGLAEEITDVFLLTNLRTLGYVFNPVSFYFLQGKTQRWVVTQIGNTFWEQKPTLLGPFTGDELTQEIPKLFYISPFLSLKNRLVLKLTWPGERLRIHIDDLSPEGKRELTAVFAATRVELTQGLILKLALRFPCMCQLVTATIHWHALKLWLKKVPFISKAANPELQQGVFVWISRKFVKRS